MFLLSCLNANYLRYLIQSKIIHLLNIEISVIRVILIKLFKYRIKYIVKKIFFGVFASLL